MENRKLPVHGLIIGSSLSLNLAVIIMIVAYTLVNCRAELCPLREKNKQVNREKVSNMTMYTITNEQ